MRDWRASARRSALYPAYRWCRARIDVAKWHLVGRPVPPPPLVKHRTIADYARRFHLLTFVETGTYRAETLSAVRRNFRQLTSIELHPGHHANAVALFADDKHVTVLQGDSAQRLPEVLAGLTGPALFWLDAHYSAGDTARGSIDTPVSEELSAILSDGHGPHVVLIDDARDFNGTDSYPTVDEVREMVHRQHPTWEVSVRDDIIRIHPQEPA